MRKLFKILAVIVIIIVMAGLGGYIYIANALPDAGPMVEVEISHTDSALIARGEYLTMHVTGCVDCHTPRHLEYFGIPSKQDSLGAGGFAFTREMGAPGNFYSKNITPAGIGKWTDAQLFHTTTTGVNLEGEPLFPIMPYPNFAKADPEDLKAIIAYIRTLKPIENSVAESEPDFPLNLIMRTIPKPAEFTTRPHPSNTVEYGKYLVTIGNCNDCHTPIDEQGQPLPGMYLAGGRAFTFPFGTVNSANITPDKATGIGTWTRETFISMFKQYDNPEAHSIPWEQKGFQTVMPWLEYSGMTDEDLGAVYDYLRTLQPVSNKIEKWKAASEATAMN